MITIILHPASELRTFSRIIFEISPCATLSRDDREGDRGILRLDQAFELGDDDSTPMELYEALVLQLVQHTRHIQTTVVQLLCSIKMKKVLEPAG